MKTLLIENQPFADIINKTYSKDLEIFDVSRFQSAEAIAADVKSRYSEGTDMYMINVNLRIGNSHLSENNGIKLLKLLRLNHINNHVVLYSWLSRDMLMGDLRNTIIFSKGVSFHRLPDFLAALPGINDEQLALEKADETELLQLFRAEYNPDDSHFNANIIGVWQLVKAQEAYERSCGIDSSIEDGFKGVAESMNTFQALLGQYVNKSKIGCLDSVFQDALSVRNERVAVFLKRNLPKRIENKKNSIESIKQSISKNETGGTETNNTEDRKQRITRRLELYEQEKQLFQNYLELIQSEEVIHGRVMLSTEPDSDGCYDVRKQLQRTQPTIVFVDDMADQGWSDILQRIIYGEKSLCFRKVVPQAGESSESIAERVFLASKPTKKYPGADLIILDIRLKNEHGYYKPSMLSGFEVTRFLGQRINCPILMFTASNKIWTLKQAIKSNALSFWTKGNYDSQAGDVVKDYFDLIEKIHSLVSVKWICELIADIKDTVRLIKVTTTPFWWETYEVGFWLEAKDSKRKGDQALQKQYFERSLTSKTTIIDLLNNVTVTMMKGLRSLFTRGTDVDLNSICNIMILQLSFVLDEIHRSKGIGPKDVEPGSLQTRMLFHLPNQTELVVSLCLLRNLAVHRGGDSYLDKDQIRYFVRTLLKYVTQDMTYENKIDEAADCCPLSERRQAMENGQTIKVTIIRKDRYKKGFSLYFRMNEDVEKSGETLFVYIHDKLSEYYQVGDVISVRKNYIESLGIYQIHLVPQITPVEDRLTKLDQGEVIFVNIERLAENDRAKKYGFKTGENDYLYAKVLKTDNNGIRYYENAALGDIIFVIKDGAYIRPFGLCPCFSQ